MKKLIVKSRLDANSIAEQRIAAIGLEMSPVIWQHERVYIPHDYRPEQNLPRLVLRTEVRDTEQPASYFMYLKRHIEDSGVDWVNFTPVTDYSEAAGIIHQLGFREAAEISRQRREAHLDDHMVLYLDKVEKLDGTFIKIEAELSEDEPVEALRADLFKVLQMLGQETFILQAYFDLIKNSEEPFLVPS